MRARHPLGLAPFLFLTLPLFLLAIGAGLLSTSGCGDDTVGPGNSPPTLDSLWPNADGTSWSYLWLRTDFSGDPSDPGAVYPSPEEVPPVPSLEQAYDILVGGPVTSASVVRQYFELSFDGADTTRSGAVGQKLEETVYSPDQGIQKFSVDGQRSRLAQLARFRPDLRQTLEPWLDENAIVKTSGAEASVRMDGIQASPANSEPAAVLIVPFTLLHGGVFEKTEEHIGTYGNLDPNLAWMYLNSELEVGSRFDFQLVPSLRSDAWVHAWIRRQFTYESDGKRYPNSLECVYLIDFGVNESSPGSGEFSRHFTVGTIVFAPGTGPVYSNERAGINTSLEDTDGWAYNELTLLPAGLPIPGQGNPQATLENIWPNADSNSWYYSVDTKLGSTDLAPSGDDPLPSMEELYAWLQGPTSIDSLELDSKAFMNLQFDGMKTTESGAVGQNLKETFYLPLGSELMASEVNPSLDLLRQILRVRPDLKDKASRLYPLLMAALGSQKAAYYGDLRPFFLFGYAWEKTEDYIGTYGDVDRLLAWKFLERNLSPRHSFSLQLVPALADDIWLYGRVWQRLDFSVGDRHYANCIEVLYVVDFGVQTMTDEYGNLLGTARPYAAGTIIYAPTVGPIHSYERVIRPMGELLQDRMPGATERVVDLVEAQVAEVDQH